MRSELTPKDLICIRRSAEDAAYAMNRNHKPFIEAVSHPLNIIALVDMAQSSLSQQSKVDELQLKIKRLIESEENIARGCEAWRNAHRKADERVDELQKRVDAALWLLKVYRDEMDHGFEVSKATVKKIEQALKGEGCQ